MTFKTFQRLHLLLLLLGDIITGVASFLLAFQIAFLIHQVTDPYATWLPFPPYNKLAIIWTFLNLLVFSFGGLYSRRPWDSYAAEVGGILTAISTSMVFAMAITFFVKGFEFSRLVFITAWILAIILFWIERGILRIIRRGWYRAGKGLRRLAVWGDDEVAVSLLNLYMKEPWRGKIPVALIDGTGEISGDIEIQKLSPVDGRTWISEDEIDEVIVTRHDLPRDEIYKLAQECRTHEVALKIVPDLLQVVAGRMSVEGVEGVPMVEMGNNLSRYYPQLVKRVFDLIVGLIITILISPVLLFCTILVLLGGPGPILFKHDRLGKNRKSFGQFKFRTMVPNADEILNNDPQLLEQFRQGFKLKNDPRITRFGGFMRRWSLDELPQLFNVLRGEMSLVGPRPIVEKEIEKYGSFADALFSVTPGMTGLWQVSGRSDVGYEERVKLDLLYIQNWTLWEDLRILVLTPGAVLSGRGSY
ncbi:MAG TPA: sugar transferase [bacterium]